MYRYSWSHWFRHLFRFQSCHAEPEWITRQNGRREMWAICAECNQPVLLLLTNFDNDQANSL